jgi:hypothetical protein
LQPHLIEGSFERCSNPGRMTFCWNPQRALAKTVKATVLSSYFPSLKMEAEVRFSIRHPQPKRHRLSFSKGFSTNNNR